jgi:serine/threonine protein kinase
METLIDPMNLTDQHKILLNLLFMQHGKTSVFSGGEPYEIAPPTRTKSATAKIEPIKIVLTQTIYKRPRKNHPREFRYDILDPQVFEEGTHCSIHKVSGTFKRKSALGRTTFQLSTKNNRRLAKVERSFYSEVIWVNNPETNQPEAKRIIDTIDDDLIEETYYRVYNEMQLANLAGSGHMKQPAVVINYDTNIISTYTTMRERKGSNLFDVIVNSRNSRSRTPYTTLQRLEISLSTLLALKAMHAKGVIHRDIKSENMFYRFDKNQTKFIDFGYAKMKNTPDKIGEGTENYIAPELFADEASDEKSDLYSLGITLSLLWGNKEQDKDDQGKTLNRDRSVYYDPDFTTLFRGMKIDFTDLEKTMLKSWFNRITEKDRNKRVSVDEAIDDLTDFISLYKKNRPGLEKKSDTSIQKFNLFNKKRTPVNDAKTTEAVAATAPRLSGSKSH